MARLHWSHECFEGQLDYKLLIYYDYELCGAFDCEDPVECQVLLPQLALPNQSRLLSALETVSEIDTHKLTRMQSVIKVCQILHKLLDSQFLLVYSLLLLLLQVFNHFKLHFLL